MSVNARLGLLIIISSPSGAGKSTLAKRLLADDDRISFSVSATTRAMRASEVDGQDYYFKTREEFQVMVAADEMLEHAEVFDNFYGSPLGPVSDAINQGHDVLFDVPAGITVTAPKPTEIIVEGIDQQQVGEVAAKIREWRKPEPYKGKGIKYKDEYIFRKEGKSK